MARAPGKSEPQTQVERTAAMRARLIAATKSCLMERGYGRTNAVEVCARAGVTRGALFHHFKGLPDLLAATLDDLCTTMALRGRAIFERQVAAGAHRGLAAYVERAWAIYGEADAKMVFEAWLAARNDPDLAPDLDPVIQRFRALASPDQNPRLGEAVGLGPRDIAYYRLITEALIGMALGRAVTPGGKPMGHEDVVLALLGDLAAQQDAQR